jgi:hypothetical protein
MLKYEYENATVYITKPTEKHIENIKKATEVFMKKVIKEQINNDYGRNRRWISSYDINARGGN